MSIVTVIEAAPSYRLFREGEIVRATSHLECVVPETLVGLAESFAAQFVQMVGRPLALETVKETFILGRLPRRAWLARYPLVELQAVAFDGVALTIDEDVFVEIDTMSQLLFPGARTATDVGGSNTVAEAVMVGDRPRKLEVTYRAGYVLPGWAGQSATLPPFVENAIAEAVAEQLVIRERDPTMVQEKIGDYSATYAGNTDRTSQGAASSASSRLEAAAMRFPRRPVL